MKTPRCLQSCVSEHDTFTRVATDPVALYFNSSLQHQPSTPRCTLITRVTNPRGPMSFGKWKVVTWLSSTVKVQGFLLLQTSAFLLTQLCLFGGINPISIQSMFCIAFYTVCSLIRFFMDIYARLPQSSECNSYAVWLIPPVYPLFKKVNKTTFLSWVPGWFSLWVVHTCHTSRDLTWALTCGLNGTNPKVTMVSVWHRRFYALCNGEQARSVLIGSPLSLSTALISGPECFGRASGAAASRGAGGDACGSVPSRLRERWRGCRCPEIYDPPGKDTEAFNAADGTFCLTSEHRRLELYECSSRAHLFKQPVVPGFADTDVPHHQHLGNTPEGFY